VGEGGDNLAFDGNPMLIDLSIERLAERDGIFRSIAIWRGLIGVVEPKSKAIKKVKTSPVSDAVPIRLIVGAEEDRRCEDALKALRNAAIMAAIFREAKEVQHLCSAVELDCPALLLDSERRDPNGNQPVLAERQTKFGMRGDFKKELTVASCVCKLIFGRRAKWKATKDERTSVVSKPLASTVPLVADQSDCFKLPEFEL
jgi:hypothetical protein